MNCLYLSFHLYKKCCFTGEFNHSILLGKTKLISISVIVNIQNLMWLELTTSEVGWLFTVYRQTNGDENRKLSALSLNCANLHDICSPVGWLQTHLNSIFIHKVPNTRSCQRGKSLQNTKTVSTLSIAFCTLLYIKNEYIMYIRYTWYTSLPVRIW